MPTATKERPLTLKDWEVRAVQDGRKTQLRIPLNPQPKLDDDGIWKVSKGRGSFVGGYRRNEETGETQPYSIEETAWEYCRNLGRVGDRLWVKEAFRQTCCAEGFSCIAYRAGGKARYIMAEYEGEGDPVGLGEETDPIHIRNPKDIKWHSSIHMPRAYCRLTLEIADIRVERLQEISREDAIAEGISVLPLQDSDDPTAWWESSPGKHQARSPQESFAMLWNDIYGPGSWSANPFVWKLVFRRVE